MGIAGEKRRADQTERLDKVLARAALGSRKDVRVLIRAGRVSVDGEVVRDPAARVHPARSRVELDGEPVAGGSMTFMLSKPAGYVTATEDARQPTVLDLFPPALARRLFPAGRLDKDTEGLLIVTDDGDLCHRLISPRHGVEKEYLARVDGALSPALIESFAAGVLLADGYRTRPAGLRIVDAGPPGLAAVTLTEGKYHQVKRMFAAHGLRVTALRRVRIGRLELDPALAPGEYRPLTPDEMERLFENPPAT